MGSTTNLSLPYPSSSDAPDGPTQIQALADALDDLVYLVETGTVTLNLDSEALQSSAVTFSESFTAAPVVVASSDNTLYNAQARTVTSSGFTAGVRHINNTAATETVILSWIAVGLPA